MRVPLHIHPDRNQKADDQGRLTLHYEAMQLNPSGFRRPSDRTDRRRPPTRVEVLAGTADDPPERSQRRRNFERLRQKVGPFNDPAVQERVRRMTAWQRHQWARKGHPTNLSTLTKFTKMERPS